MKIANITMKDFLAYRSLDLDLEEKISLFAGKNGAGKSGILDAIRACFVGTARDIARGDAGQLARWGTRSWNVELGIPSTKSDQQVRVRRTATTLTAGVGDKKQTVKQEWLTKVIRDPGVFDAVLDAWKALSMSPTDRKALVFRLTGIKVTEEQLREKGLTVDECLKAALAGDWRKAERLAAQSKRDAARVLKEQRIPEVNDVTFGSKKVSEIPVEKVEEFRKAIEKYRADERRLVEQIARINATAEISTQSLEETRGELLARQKEAGDPKTLENRHFAIRREIKEREETIAESRKGLAKEQETLRQAEQAVKELNVKRIRCEGASGEHECPICHLKHESPEAPSPARVKEAKTLHDNAVKRAAEQGQVVSSGEEFIERIVAEKKKFEHGLLDVVNLIDRRASIDTELERISAKIAAAGSDREDPAASEQELDAVRAKIEKGRRILEAVGTYRREQVERDAAVFQRKALEDEVERFAKAEQLLRPDGLQTEFLAPARQPIIDRLALWSEFVGFDLVLTDDFDIRLDNGEDGGAPVSLLSGSEQWRVALALADALAQLSGLRFLALDEVPWPDKEKRNALYKALVQVSGDYDQILVFAVLGDLPLRQSKNPDLLRVYLVEDAKVAPAPAKEPAGAAA